MGLSKRKSSLLLAFVVLAVASGLLYFVYPNIKSSADAYTTTSKLTKNSSFIISALGWNLFDISGYVNVNVATIGNGSSCGSTDIWTNNKTKITNNGTSDLVYSSYVYGSSVYDAILESQNLTIKVNETVLMKDSHEVRDLRNNNNGRCNYKVEGADILSTDAKSSNSKIRVKIDATYSGDRNFPSYYSFSRIK